MADDEPWLLKEDGYLNVETACDSVIYHPNLNVLLITTLNERVLVLDVNSGLILQKSQISGEILIFSRTIGLSILLNDPSFRLIDEKKNFFCSELHGKAAGILLGAGGQSAVHGRSSHWRSK